MFLELVREVAAREPELARDALKGLSLYSEAKRAGSWAKRPEAARAGAASLRDHGGSGAPVVLVPSLINPPHILDLDGEVSLTEAIAAMGRRPLLIDWGEVSEREDLSIADHVERLLIPLLDSLGERAVLIGYCLGGTMAMAAAAHKEISGIATLASPWHFSRYPSDGRAALLRLWKDAFPSAQALGVLPLEVLQASFWSLDPERTVRKFAALNAVDPHGPEFRRFVALEDWANEGDPLPLPAARELLEDLFTKDVTGEGRWIVGGKPIDARLACPAIHFTAARDRITPADTAPDGVRAEMPAGHVGMVVGRSRLMLHKALAAFLASCR